MVTTVSDKVLAQLEHQRRLQLEAQFDIEAENEGRAIRNHRGGPARRINRPSRLDPRKARIDEYRTPVGKFK